MDGVSGVIAIVSFSIQLVDSIQKANKFLKEVQNAPEEVIRLAEKYLHSEQNYLIEPHWLGSDRQLVFKLGGKPRISWEWWFDPLSPGGLVCHEFRNMNLVHERSYFRGSQDLFLWKGLWPFVYPGWSDYNDPGTPIFPLISQAQDIQDGEERMIKPWQELKRKAACRHAPQTRMKYPQYFREFNDKPPMPGAWIGD